MLRAAQSGWEGKRRPERCTAALITITATTPVGMATGTVITTTVATLTTPLRRRSAIATSSAM